MPLVPVHCPHCGGVFEGRGGISIESGGSVDLGPRGGITTCPRCGKTANFVAGTFTEKNGRLEIKDAPPLTYDVFERLEQLVEQVRSGQISQDDLVKGAEQLHEGVGSAFAYLVMKYPKSMMVLIAFIALMKSCQGTVNLNQLVDQLAAAVPAIESSENPEEEIAKVAKEAMSNGTIDVGLAPKGGRLSKAPSRRRKNVNKARRQMLLHRRRAFSPR